MEVRKSEVECKTHVLKQNALDCYTESTQQVQTLNFWLTDQTEYWTNHFCTEYTK